MTEEQCREAWMKLTKKQLVDFLIDKQKQLSKYVVENFKINKTFTSIILSRNNLYDALPSGNIDAFALINVIQNHIEELDKIIESIDKHKKRT